MFRWSLGLLLCCLVHSAEAAILNVTNSTQLTSAMSSAVAGDEIVLANGMYSGTFTTNNAGTAGSKITLRAANRHQAILVGDNVCDRSHEGLVLADAYWIVKDLKFTQHGRAIRITAPNVEVAHNILDGYREEGIRVDGGDNNFIHHNVIGHSFSCSGTDSPGIYVVTNADFNTIQENIILATGDNGYMCGGGGGCSVGDKFGYGIFVANNSDDNLFQGNLLLANGGKGVFRILSDGTNSSNADRNLVRDNLFFHGEGGTATDDCNDDSNSFINNIFYGNYFWNWYTKGNDNGNRGHHLLQHNLFFDNDFTRGSVGFIATGGTCSFGGSSLKVQNTVKDNLFYATGTLTGAFDSRILLTLSAGTQSSLLAANSHNLFWGPSATSTWVRNYSYAGTDIHASGQQPLFVSIPQGNFTLTSASPGKGAASDGTDIGIAYNNFLKQTWSAQVAALPTQEQTGLTGVTSTSFAVHPSRYHQVYFYLPNSPCSSANQTITIEGTGVARDINTLVSGGWVQPGGPARWITLGRHRATDGTLNVAWQTANCVERLFIRELPTSDEAYTWITTASPPDITTALEMHLRLDDGTGTTAADATGKGHTGTLSGGTAWVSGQIGSGALSLNGTTGQVQVSGLLGQAPSLTLAVWVKINGFSGSTPQEVISLGDHVGMRVSASTVQAFYSTSTSTWTSVDVSTALSTTQWHHLAWVIQAGLQQLYLDGVAIGSANQTAAISYAGLGSNTFLGTHGNGQAGYRYNGLLDDVRVYTRALTANDVAALAAYRSQAPTLTITQPVATPTYSIDAAALTTLAGTASDEVAVTSVTWACPTCTPTSGTATGTTAWSVPTLTLAAGTNVITVTATDGEQQTGQDVLTVTYTPAPPATSTRVVPALSMGGAGRR